MNICSQSTPGVEVSVQRAIVTIRELSGSVEEAASLASTVNGKQVGTASSGVATASVD